MFFDRLGIKTDIERSQIKNNIANAFDKVNDTFPNLKINQYVNKVIEEKIKEDDCVAETDGKTIKINRGITNKKANQTLEKRTNYPDLLKLHPDGRATINGRIDTTADIIHEIGHTIGHTIGEKDKKRDALFEDYVNEKFNIDDCRFDLAPTELSLYASSDSKEFFAEAFADYVINKDKASKIGKLIPEFLKEQGII